MCRELALAALRRALNTRRPAPGLIRQSDRGSQYASNEYQAMLTDHEAVCSMSRAGDCYDNAVAASFFASLEKESSDVGTLRLAPKPSAITAYIDGFYNPIGRHSALNHQSPIDFECAASYQYAA
jgi:putative transposase